MKHSVMQSLPTNTVMTQTERTKMVRYTKKEDTKAGMIYDKVEMRYIKDSEIVPVLNRDAEQLESVHAEMIKYMKCFDKLYELTKQHLTSEQLIEINRI